MFAVVEFPGHDSSGNELAVVPLIWIHKNNKRCYWPTSTGCLNFTNFIKKQVPPKKTWPSYDVLNIHFKSEAYDSAEEYLKELLRDNEVEVEESGGSVNSLVRKCYEDTTYEEQSQDEDGGFLSLDPTYTNPAGTSSTEMNLQGYVDTTNGTVESHYKTKKNSENFSENRKQSKEKDSPVAITTTNSESNTSLASTLTVKSGEFSTLWESITKLTAHVEQQTIMLHELIRIVRKSDQQLHLHPPPDLPSFPIKTLQEFEDLNEKLADQTITDYLIGRLAAVGGSTLDSLTRRILKFLITDDVAVEYNWKGREKKSFEKTKIMSIIYDAVKRNFPADERNDLLIANTCKEWLKHAKGRMNSKKKGNSSHSSAQS